MNLVRILLHPAVERHKGKGNNNYTCMTNTQQHIQPQKLSEQRAVVPFNPSGVYVVVLLEQCTLIIATPAKQSGLYSD